MTKWSAIAAELLTALNTPAPPAGVPAATRDLGVDLAPTDATAIRLRSHVQKVADVHNSRVVAFRQHVFAVECWAQQEGATSAEEKADPLVEHVLSRLEGKQLAGVHAVLSAEIQWAPATKDGTWIKATVFLPVQFQTKVGAPTA